MQTSPLLTEKQATLAARLGLIWSVVLSAVFCFGLFDGGEELLSDRLQRLPGLPQTEPDLALIAIQHVPSDRPWPWPRLDYALILRGLANTAPQSVVFEMLLHDRDPRFSAFDNSFADQITRTQRVLFAAAALHPEDARPMPANLRALPARGNLQKLNPFGSFFWPVETFSTLGEVGICNLSAEKNRNLRDLSLVFRYREQLIPSLALTAAALRLEADLAQTSVNLGSHLLLRNAKGEILRRIPIDGEGRLRLRFRLPRPEIPRINYDNLLLAADQAERGAASDTDLSPLRRRQVWVAATDPEIVPQIETISGPLAPVDIHLQATRQILREDYVIAVPRVVSVLLFIISGVLLAHAFITARLRQSFLVMLALAVLVNACAVAAFLTANLTFPLFTFTIHLVGVYLCGLAAKYWELQPPATPDPQIPLKFE